MGSRYVEVFECLDEDFLQSKRRAIASSDSSSSASLDVCGALRLRGLPYGARVADIEEFMGAWPVEQVPSCCAVHRCCNHRVQHVSLQLS
jgi:hypothetical protein